MPPKKINSTKPKLQKKGKVNLVDNKHEKELERLKNKKEESEEEIVEKEEYAEANDEEEDLSSNDEIEEDEEVEEKSVDDEVEGDDDDKIKENGEDDNCVYNFADNNSEGEEAEEELIFDDDNLKDDETILSPENRITKPILYKYERVRLLGDRTQQLTLGAKPMIKNTQDMPPNAIARLEMEQNLMPLKIVRTLPNGKKEIWKLEELKH